MERKNWKEIDGDNTLALDWPLRQHSNVWEIGGFEGRWAKQMSEKFGCFVTVFEPQLWAVRRIMDENIPRLILRPYGLWVTEGAFPMGNYHTDGCSLVRDDKREPTQLGGFIDIRDELIDPNEDIDVALMNIEGAEFVLIPHMIEYNLMRHFNYFWCQFHPQDYTDEATYQQILSGMAETHDLLWDCYPTAVAWRRR